jgi:hypothetical protein
MATGRAPSAAEWLRTWRALVEAWNRGDRDFDLSFLHPEFRVHSVLMERVFVGPAHPVEPVGVGALDPLLAAARPQPKVA